MRTSTRRIGGSGRRYTAQDRAAIFQGLPVTMLAELFQMKRQNVERRLATCPTAGVNQTGSPLYRVADAAQFLVRIKLTDEQVRETLQRADPKDFPAMTNKMFWEGLIQRRKYEELTGDLWHTSDVVSVASSAFNAIRMSLLLLPDELSDKAGMNEQQRSLVQDTVDAMLESCRDALVDELRKPSRSGQQPSTEEGDL
jgi:hypothetical protein